MNDERNALKKETTQKLADREYFVSAPGVTETGVMPTIDSKQPFATSRKEGDLMTDEFSEFLQDNPFYGFDATWGTDTFNGQRDDLVTIPSTRIRRGASYCPDSHHLFSN